MLGYEYYTQTYIPEKLLNNAIKEITKKINSDNDSIKSSYALYVLKKNYEWKYDNVDNNQISERLSEYRESAFKHIDSLAYSGNAKFQFVLGCIYNWGGDEYHYYEKPDLSKAAYWWNEAIKQNYGSAYNNLGFAYLQGEGVNKDVRKGVELIKKGAELGEDWAQRNYGDFFQEGIMVEIGTHKETIKSNHQLYGSNERRNPKKIREYVDYNTFDRVYVYQVDIPDYEPLIPKDIEQAKYWWKKSAAQGNEVAKERLQKLYE